jgi:tRNA pseudouridine55 synthase
MKGERRDSAYWPCSHSAKLGASEQKLMNAVIVVDKPAGMTSHDVVNRLRRMLGQRSVGHVGTLDPAATGVLVLVSGNWTRLAQFYDDAEKEYEGVIRLGFSTDSYDAEGEATSEPVRVQVTLEEIIRAAARFQGPVQQIPPRFSAKKIQGVPAYKLARKSKDVDLAPVEVQVHELAILGLERELITFRARVGSGTYVRSIAHDLGQVLACGGHLLNLRRTALGEFRVSEAHSLDNLEQAAREGRIEEMFVHPRRVLPQFPSVAANEEQLSRIRSGRTVNLPEMSRSRFVKVFCGQAELVCIAQRVAGTLFHPKIVLIPQPMGTQHSVPS